MTEMRYRTLGQSGVSVSVLCLGTMNFGGPTDEPEARRIIDHAVDAGVNFIDTANVYTEGRSEEIVGRALQGRRHLAFLATKVAHPTGPRVNDRGLSRVHVTRAIEASLKRLNNDYINLYSNHKVALLTPWKVITRAFAD